MSRRRQPPTKARHAFSIEQHDNNRHRPITVIYSNNKIIATTSIATTVLALVIVLVWKHFEEGSLITMNSVRPNNSSESSAVPQFKIIMEDVSKQAIELERLTLVSMNIAGCVPSQEAPSNWDSKIACEAIRAELLRNRPDILFLQEYPHGKSKLEEQFGDNYQIMGMTPSHAGQVVLLVRKGITAKPRTTSVDSDFQIPVVMAELQFHQKRKVLIASVHLAPFLEGSYERDLQVDQLLQEASSWSPPPSTSIPLIFAGDTNMRESEDENIERKGLLDIWKAAGSDPQTEYTWDAIDHTTATNTHNGYFNQYYGETTRQYNARYDRIYCTTTNSSTLLSPIYDVLSFELIANKPLTSKYHFLSDHFGVSAVLNLRWET